MFPFNFDAMVNSCIKSILIILTAFYVVGCENNVDGSASSGNEANRQFDSFRHNFAPANLPLTIKGCYLVAAIKADNYVELTKKRYPLYVDNDNGDIAYCLFKTNGDYTALISLGRADCYIPILTTYDRVGKKIDEKEINIGGCGFDCGFTCEEFMTIKADYTIYTSDTITSFECDTAGNEIPGTK